MSKHAIKTISLISALALASACDKKEPKLDPPNVPVSNQAKLVQLSGSVDKDLQGSWTGPCRPLLQGGSQRLVYQFDAQGLVVQESIDLLRSACENPALVNTYRLNAQTGVWLQDQPFVRSIPLRLVQVTAQSKSEQLTKNFNRDYQCGLENWKTLEERDVTGMSCLGTDSFDLPMTLTDSMSFQLNVLFKGKNILLQGHVPGDSYGSALARLFQADQEVRTTDGRDLGVLFWNNEIPTIGTVEQVKTLALSDLPPLEGEGSFYVNSGLSTTGKWSVKNGLAVFKLQAPQTMPDSSFVLNAGSLYDEKSRKHISFRFDATKKIFAFSSYESGTQVTSQLVDIPVVDDFVFNFKALPGADAEAPVTELLAIPSNVVLKQKFEVRIRATDDVSGIGFVVLGVEYQHGDSTFVAPHYSSVLTYEGNSTYRATFELMNYDSLTQKKRVVSVGTRDRVGHESEPLPLDIRISQ